MRKITVGCFLLFSIFSLAQGDVDYSLKKRIWSKENDDGCHYPIGNGNMLIYEEGPNIINLFGPPYSAPSYLQMYLQDRSGTKVESRREKNTAIWHHIVYEDGKAIAQITDYILADKNVFFRDFEVKEEISFNVIIPQKINLYPMQNYFKYITNTDHSSVLLSIPAGTNFFVNNPISEELSLFLVATGSVTLSEPANGSFFVKMNPGKSRIIMCSNTSYPKTIETAENVLKNPETDWLNQSRRYWLAFSARRLNFNSMIPPGNVLKDTLLDAIDGVSVALKCQQAASGGEIAGSHYNMAYVRDQSGVIRGFLALGYYPEAKAIIDFRIEKFRKFGNLMTAEGMGNDAARLPLINDDVENTAYTILMCFQYYQKTHDEEILKRALPMMIWAFEVQLSHIVNGMTEFSGDETYRAGHTLICSAYEGSAESTLLFITGGDMLLDWVSKNGLWQPDKIDKYRKIIADAKDKYRKNFVVNGILYTNSPEREKNAVLPRFRFGFCEYHGKGQKTPIITWTERIENGKYVCPDCRKKVIPNAETNNRPLA